MPEISVRQANTGDTEIVARFVHALLEELADGAPPKANLIHQNTEEVLREPSVVAMIAYAQEKPVGVMVLNECAAIYAGGRFAEISELYMRSQGVAPNLLNAAIAEASNRNWKRIEVGAPPQAAWRRTMAFYLRNGFTEVGPRLRRLIRVRVGGDDTSATRL